MDQSGLCRAVCLLSLGGCLAAPAAAREQILNLLHDLIDLLGLADAADQPDLRAAARKLGEPSVGSLMSTAIPGSCRVALYWVRPRCQKDRRSVHASP